MEQVQKLRYGLSRLDRSARTEYSIKFGEISATGLIHRTGTAFHKAAGWSDPETRAKTVKRTFELLFINGVADGGTGSDASDASAVTAVGSDTTSGARQGAKWHEKEALLKALAVTHSLATHTEEALVGPTGDAVMCDVEWPIDKIGRQSIIIIAGSPGADQLVAAVKTLKDRGLEVIIAVDALKNLRRLLPTLARLNEQGVEMVAAGGVESLVTGEELMVYRYPKGDSTATIAAFADLDQEDPLVLAMIRGRAPFKGDESFPGGFLNIQLESLPECAARELMEECFVNPDAKGEEDRFTYQVSPDDMELIDVRSDPDRDERGHVVDHGFAWFIPKDKQAEVISKVNAGDDAQAGSARFVRVSVLMGFNLAFDHKKLLVASLAKLRKTFPAPSATEKS
jgi:ADP-ribose pyrophosphatase YjhB (NUDIX family)